MEIKIELIRFIKNNIKKVIFISFSTFLLILGLIFLIDVLSGNSSENENINDQIYTHQFDFYIENPDGTSFSNPSIIEENIIMTETYKEIEEEHNLTLIIDNEITEEIEEKEIEFKFRLNRDSNSGRYTFALALENLLDSRKAIEEFYSLFENNELGVLENKNVVMFTEPYLLEPELEDAIETNNNNYFRLRNIVLGALLSIAVSVIVIILNEVLSKTINYYFSYDADKYDHFVLIDKELHNYNYFETLITGNQVFLSDNSNELKKYNKTSAIYDELLEINDISKYDEIIIIVFPFKTTKLWYKKQKEMLVWHNKPVRIIQVNNFER